MARSRRHVPISAVTCCESNKPFKKQEHGRERSKVKMMLHMGFEDYALPHPKHYGNEWASPRDGKEYFGDLARPTYFKIWNHLPYNDLWTPQEIKAIYNKGMRK